MTPTLYSFRRCPYAMRARLALVVSGQQVVLREVALRDKPAAFLAVSDSATVPCLVTQSGVIDESLEIMTWSLRRADPQNWLAMPDAGWDLITQADGPFKEALDRTKYATRYPESDAKAQRRRAAEFLSKLDTQITDGVLGPLCLADFAILPFVRQFAFIDKPWFDAQRWPALQGWLDRFLASSLFEEIMPKYTPWAEGDPPTLFP